MHTSNTARKVVFQRVIAYQLHLHYKFPYLIFVTAIKYGHKDSTERAFCRKFILIRTFPECIISKGPEVPLNGSFPQAIASRLPQRLSTEHCFAAFIKLCAGLCRKYINENVSRVQKQGNSCDKSVRNLWSTHRKACF